MSLRTFVTKPASMALRGCTRTATQAASSCLLQSSSRLPCIQRSTYTTPYYTSSYEQIPEWFSIKSVFLTPTHNTLVSLQAPQTGPFPREIIFLGGAPGAGKGSNSMYISNLRHFDAPTIVVSDLLKTPACKALKDRGIMVDDDFVYRTLLEELQKPKYRQGVVVDGFPRTEKQIAQLRDLSDACSATRMCFVMLNVDEQTSIQRQQARGCDALRQMSKGSVLATEVRATDLDVNASKARYSVFQEYLHSIAKLTIPLLMVDASNSIDVVRANIASQMATLPY